MFKVNDKVLYGSLGVCKITETVTKEIKGKTHSYYVLRPIYKDNTAIFVPTNNEELLGRMKKVLSSEEITDLIKTIPDGNCEWIDNDSLRHKSYREVLSSGDRCAVASLIKALCLEQCQRKEKKRKLSTYDEVLLNQAETLLYDELASVLNIDPGDVFSFLKDKIDQNALQKLNNT